jgi:hypothetical protein
MKPHTKTHLYEFVTDLYESMFVLIVLREHMTKFIHENICGVRKPRLAAG